MRSARRFNKPRKIGGGGGSEEEESDDGRTPVVIRKKKKPPAAQGQPPAVSTGAPSSDSESNLANPSSCCNDPVLGHP